jgi:hypothetical protein
MAAIGSSALYNGGGITIRQPSSSLVIPGTMPRVASGSYLQPAASGYQIGKAAQGGPAASGSLVLRNATGIQPMTSGGGPAPASNGGGGGGGGPATGPYTDPAAAQAAAERNNTLYSIDAGINSAQSGIGRLDHQYEVGAGNIGREAEAANGKLNSQYQLGERNHNLGVTEDLNNYLHNKSQNETGARSWLEGAQRVLGGNGAGAGSAARYGVTGDAQHMADTGNAEAQATNNRNIGKLDLNWRDMQDQIETGRKDVARQKQQGEQDLQGKIAGQRATLLDTIRTLTGQKTIANGGDYKTALAASDPLTAQINALLGHIDDLAATPAINAPQITTAAPTLDGYNFARPTAPTAPQQDESLSNPVLAALYGDPNRRDKVLQ